MRLAVVDKAIFSFSAAKQNKMPQPCKAVVCAGGSNCILRVLMSSLPESLGQGWGGRVKIQLVQFCGWNLELGTADHFDRLSFLAASYIYKEGGTFGHSFASAPCNLQAPPCNLQAAPCNLQAAPCNLQAAPCNLQATSLQLVFQKKHKS